MPHEDGSAYWPLVATLSLLSTVVLDIYEKGEDGQRSQKPRWRVLQEPRSLLVTGKDMYINSLHGISDVLIDEDLGPATITNWTMLGDTAQFLNGQNNRDLRISLTYRDVLKVADVDSKLRLPGRLD
ncbi:MAG: hypothetical protein M1825_006477 [Sarcosagium campestre]|nr:MAG: hypothetical protein M1825_006477 [Sarcosagium campestre]